VFVCLYVCRPKRPRRAPSIVLNEDAFVDSLQTIIERDYYPDLQRIRTKLQWMEAKEKGDYATMREIQQRYGGAGGAGMSTQRVSRTPAALQTPAAIGGSSSFPAADLSTSMNPLAPSSSLSSSSPASLAATVVDEAAVTLDKNGNPVDTTLPLDKFVATYTSEDNAAYEQLADAAHQKFRERNSWVEQAALKNQRFIEGPEAQERTNTLRTWNYAVRNRLMYYPDAIDPEPTLAITSSSSSGGGGADDAATSTTSSTRVVRGEPKAINRDNTRFAVPEPVIGKRRRGAEEAAAAAAAVASSANVTATPAAPLSDAELMARRRAELKAADEAPLKGPSDQSTSQVTAF
jgi:hypothetical protein